MNAGQIEWNPGESMESLLEKLNDYIAKWLHSTERDSINGRRTEILKNCIAEGERIEIRMCTARTVQ